MGTKSSKLKTNAKLTVPHDDSVMVDSLELSIEKTSCWGQKKRLLAAFAFPRQGWASEPSGGMSCRCLKAAAVPLERLRKKQGDRAVTIRCLAGGRQVFASEVSLAELLQRLGLTARDGEATLLLSLGTEDSEGGEANSASFNVLFFNGLRCASLDSAPKEPQHGSDPETPKEEETDLALKERKNGGSVKQEEEDCVHAYYSLDLDEDDGYEADDEDESLPKEAKIYKDFEDNVSLAPEDEDYDADDEDETQGNKQQIYTYNDGGSNKEEDYEGDIEDELVEEEICKDTGTEDDKDGQSHKHGQTNDDWCTVEEEDDMEECDGGVVCPGGEAEGATILRHRRPPIVSPRSVTATREARPVKRRGDFWLEVVAIGAAIVLLLGLGALLFLTLWLDFGQPLWRQWQGAHPHPAMPSGETEYEDDAMPSGETDCDDDEYYCDP